MTKDEYIEKLTKYMADNDLEREDGLTYLDGIQDAVTLARQLDGPKKVVIPEFIANDIKYHKKCGYTLQGALGGTFGQGLESDVYYWFYADNGDENFRKYISAWSNGYEVEKEKKYRVLIKGFKNYSEYYINYDCDDEIICLDDKYEIRNFKTIFTKQWLKDNWSEYDTYNNAGLLEFEELEDE